MSRHVELRDLWLQQEVREGRVLVHKVPGEENPADLMTRVLGSGDIESRLKGMNIRMEMTCKEVSEKAKAKTTWETVGVKSDGWLEQCRPRKYFAQVV